MTSASRAGLSRRPGLTAVLAVAALLGALISLVAGRPGRDLGAARSGDLELTADVEAGIEVDRGVGAMAVARVGGGRTAFAGLGSLDGRTATPETYYEIGSITKVWTGMLLADAVDRGELALGDPLARHLPELTGSPVGQVTLEELATHSSGLPGLPTTGADRLRLLFNQDPYGAWSTARVIEAAQTSSLSTRGRYAYSNFGMSLLGHAVARAAGATGWTALVRQRLLEPLGMTATTFVTDGAPEPTPAARPHRSNGWPAWWTGDGFAPAGSSTRSTARDLATFAAAVLDGRAPGLAALTPRRPSGPDSRIGLAWVTDSAPYGTSVWHNGGTAGSASMLALDPAAGTAVIVLNDTDRPVETIAWRALFAGVPAAAGLRSAPAMDWPGLLGLAVALALLAGLLVKAGRAGNRVAVLAAVVDGGTGLMLALVHGPWGWWPGWVWGALAGPAVVLAVLAVRRAADRPTWPVQHRVTAAVGAAVSVAVSVAVLVAAAGTG